FQDGSWWGLLYDSARHATYIYRLDLSTQTWVNTGTVVDTRPTARGDALWDGQKLYVVSGTTVVSEFSSPPNPDDVAAGSAQLLRFSYDPTSRTYSLDPGFPATVHQGSTESITVAKDSTGELWATYTLVSPDNSSKVYVTHSVGDDATWSTPTVLPTTAASIHYDDISAIVAFQGDKVGVMWSNQLTKKFYLAVHRDGSPDSSWQTEVAYGGGVGGCSTGCANDHVNLKQLSSDGSGRIFAAIKTANRNTGQPFVVLLARDRHSAWSSYEFGAVEDLHTRPMVLIDEEHRELFMFAVSPEIGGTIYYKKTSLDNISFPPGVGTPFIQSGLDTDISDPTSTKQNLNSTTGLVVLASANTHAYYWHNYLNLAAEPAPVPAAPTGLTVSSPTSNSDSTLQLAWPDNSSNEAGFAIERKTGNASYSQIATVGTNITSYTDPGLSPGTTYTYRVRAWNSVGYSGYSDEASGTTAQTGPVRAFTPVADTYVDSSIPNTNYGTKTNLSVDASPIQESYLKFQLSGLTGNTVTSAKLRVYVSDNGSVKGGSVAKMSNISWVETGVTYNTRPSIDGATLSTLGAVNIGAWYEFDVTPAVTGDGMLSLGVKSSSTDGVHYSAREDTTHAPQLVVTVTPGDTIPPETTIDSGPSGLLGTSAASFAFSSSEIGSTFECSLDGAAFAACASPKQYAGLADGSHTFQVRAVDAVGNVDASPASRSWAIDTVPPATVIDSGPPAASNTDSASFSFSSDEQSVTFRCSLDGSAFASCTSPVQYAGLTDGSHTFQVRATDAAGNTDPQPPSSTWTVDTVAPDTTIDSGPQGASTSDSASFDFSSNEAGATFECSLDGSAFAGCTSPAQYSGLADGSHAFQVRASDAAGNVDATPAERSWTVDTTVTDTTPPTVTLTAPAADVQTVGGQVTISADAADDVAIDHVVFLVNGTAVAVDGTSPYSVAWNSATTADGPATITARAVDTSANETTSDGLTVTVDNTAPDTTIDSGPQGAVSSQSATFGFSSNEAGTTFQCSLDGSAFASCTSPVQYGGLADGSHTFRVRATDAAGNVDASPASRSWTVD
ncbi:MAG TPA: DNRLRE domain-containing protein, partial [Mycobacteriales bacterium]|nr:DNRLRE domain-containing protein [Mycobacteriales bacterium]